MRSTDYVQTVHRSHYEAQSRLIKGFVYNKDPPPPPPSLPRAPSINIHGLTYELEIAEAWYRSEWHDMK